MKIFSASEHPKNIIFVKILSPVYKIYKKDKRNVKYNSSTPDAFLSCSKNDPNLYFSKIEKYFLIFSLLHFDFETFQILQFYSTVVVFSANPTTFLGTIILWPVILCSPEILSRWIYIKV